MHVLDPELRARTHMSCAAEEDVDEDQLAGKDYLYVHGSILFGRPDNRFQRCEHFKVKCG